ncbi:MAG: hypothetical protein ABW190_15135 [Rhizobacter sp.]
MAGASRLSARDQRPAEAIALLADHGLRPTANRLAAFSALCSCARNRWMAPKAIYAELLSQGVHMHLPTVYKALGELAVVGLAERQWHPEHKKLVFMFSSPSR